MYFALTEEQRALQDSVRRYASDRFGLRAVLAVFDEPDGDGEPPQLWQAVGEQGWLAGLIPEQFGGLGRQLLDVAVIARGWGEAVLPGAVLPTLVAAEAIRLGGSADQQAEWLPRVAAGDAHLSLAFRAEGGAWSADGIGVTARSGLLYGTVVQVEYAHLARRLVVAARDERGAVGCWLVDPAGAGVSLTRRVALDGSTRLATVSFAGARGEQLACGSAAVLVAVLDRAAALYANDLAGVARAALTRTVAYCRTREQFGRPVGSFQALQHSLADLHVAVTMAEHAGWYAAHALDRALPDAALAVSMAKAKAGRAARDATAAMIQYHGGIGFTWEHEAHLFFKRAKRVEYQYGSSAAHCERVARLLVDAT